MREFSDRLHKDPWPRERMLSRLVHRHLMRIRVHPSQSLLQQVEVSAVITGPAEPVVRDEAYLPQHQGDMDIDHDASRQEVGGLVCLQAVRRWIDLEIGNEAVLGGYAGEHLRGVPEFSKFLDGDERGIDEHARVSVHHHHDDFSLSYVPHHPVGHGAVCLATGAILAVVDVQILDMGIELAEVSLCDGVGRTHKDVISSADVRLRLQGEVSD